MAKEYYKTAFAAYLIPEKDGEVLLLRRFNTGYEDGKYSLIAGHINEGESVIGAMIREAKEEADITIERENLELAHVMHRKGTIKNDERIDFFFACRKWDGEIKNMEPQKCDDLSWFDLDKLPENTIDYIKSAFDSIKRKEVYSEIGWGS